MPISSSPPFWKVVLVIFWKDLLTEWRSRELLAPMLIFALLTLFLFNFALELEVTLRATLTAGVLWVTLTFAGALGLNRSLTLEEDGGLDGLLLAPIPRAALYTGKMLSTLSSLLLMAILLLPLYCWLYNTPLPRFGLLAILLLGAFGYAAVGTLLAAMTARARWREALLPILLFPLILPLLIAAVRASSAALNGAPWSELVPWLNLLIAYDLLFALTASLAFEYIIEE